MKKSFLTLTLILLLIILFSSFMISNTFYYHVIELVLLSLHFLINAFYFAKKRRLNKNIPSLYDAFLVFTGYKILEVIISLLSLNLKPEIRIFFSQSKLVILFLAILLTGKLIKIAKAHNENLTW